jgi:hypothetical protein
MSALGMCLSCPRADRRCPQSCWCAEDSSFDSCFLSGQELQAYQDTGIQNRQAGGDANVDPDTSPQSPEPTDEEIQQAYEDFLLEMEPPNEGYDAEETWWFPGNSRLASIAGSLPSEPNASSTAFTFCADAVPFVPRHDRN